MALDPTLLEILRCPDSHHAALEYDPDAQTLTCTECRRVFEVRDGVPVLLLDEAMLPGEGEQGECDSGEGEQGKGGTAATSGGAGEAGECDSGEGEQGKGGTAATSGGAGEAGER